MLFKKGLLRPKLQKPPQKGTPGWLIDRKVPGVPKIPSPATSNWHSGGQKGQKGINKKCAQNSTLRPKLNCRPECALRTGKNNEKATSNVPDRGGIRQKGGLKR